MSIWKKLLGIKKNEQQAEENIPTREQFIDDSDPIVDDNENSTDINQVAENQIPNYHKNSLEGYLEEHLSHSFRIRIYNKGYEDATKNMTREAREEGIKELKSEEVLRLQQVVEYYEKKIRDSRRIIINRESLGLKQSAEEEEERKNYFEKKLQDVLKIMDDTKNEKGEIYFKIVSVYEKGFNDYAESHVRKNKDDE